MQNGSSTLIDHILTNSKTTSFTSGTLIGDISDHFLTFFQPNIVKGKSKPPVVKKRIYSKANRDNFKLRLYQQNWDSVINTDNVDDCYENFWNIYTSLHNESFPMTTTKFNKKCSQNLGLLTPGLLISRKTKLNLHKVALTDNVPYNWTHYKTYINIFNKLSRRVKSFIMTLNLKKMLKTLKKSGTL